MPPLSKPSNLRTFPEALLALPSDRLVAFARVALASFALIAVIFDPTVPMDGPATTILFIYLLYGVLWGGFTQYRAPGEAAHIGTHIIDITAVGLLMHFTDGPTAPFFVFFTFVLFAGTLRWNGRGAIATAIALLTLFILLGILHQVDGHLDDHDPTMMTMRVVYLAIAAAMFGYVGAYRARSRERLSMLAVWPPEQVSSSDAPALDQSLAHAAEVTRAKRIVVTWEETDEPFVYSLEWADGRSHFRREPPGTFGSIVAPSLSERAFASRPPSRGPSTGPLGPHQNPAGALDTSLAQQFDIGFTVTAPLHSRHFSGRIFLIDTERVSEEMILLAQIVASRITIELEHHRLRRQLEETAAVRERIRVARDIHDGTLQALTAAGVQLKAVAQEVPDEIRRRLDEIRQALAHHQRQLRTFVNDVLRPPATKSEPVFIRDIIGEFAANIAPQWNLHMDVEIVPGDATVTRRMGHELAHILQEAAANAARHGKANKLGVTIEQKPDGLVLRIRDDGRGPVQIGEAAGQDCATREADPRSIRERTSALGGTLTVPESPDGYELVITIPEP